jgi:hypothetical protein
MRRAVPSGERPQATRAWRSAIDDLLSTDTPVRRLSIARVLVPLLVLGARANGAPLRICVFSFHSPYEVDVFKSHLLPPDFEVLDLSPRPLPAESPGASGQRASGGAQATSWLPALCRNDLRCDVVVYSAEFAGRFFGASGVSVGLQDMEEASCQARCDGLFHHPLEVFLLACNTLATKDQDRRSPAEYLQVLLDHGFDRALAERVVALRYGPLGPSFREALRRIFMGVPRIYGFSSVAPSGDYTGPMLDKYFRTKGDYRRYLERAERDTAPNAELLAAFANTGLVQATGLRADEPALLDRQRICTIYDENESVTERLRVIRDIMDRGDLLEFIPSIQVFIDRHPPQDMKGDDRRLFEELQRSTTTRDQVLKLVRELDVSALKLEMAHFALHMEWMPRDELRKLTLDAARQLLRRPLTSEVVDVMCEIPKHEFIGDQFGSDDISELLFHDPEGVRLIDCLSPTDPRVGPRLVRALDGADESLRLWAAYALSRRLPLVDAVLIKIAGHLDDPSPGVRARLQWLFTAATPLSSEVRQAVWAHDPTFAQELNARRKSH